MNPRNSLLVSIGLLLKVSAADPSIKEDAKAMLDEQEFGQAVSKKNDFRKSRVLQGEALLRKRRVDLEVLTVKTEEDWRKEEAEWRYLDNLSL